MKENYTIVVMPPNRAARTYVLGVWGWRSLLVGFLLLVVAVIAGFSWAVWLRNQKSQVETQYTALKSDHDQIQQELEEARRYLDKLKELDENIRNVLFDESEEPAGEKSNKVGLGQGGFDEALPEEMGHVSTEEVLPSLPLDDATNLDVGRYAALMFTRLESLQKGIEQEQALYDGFPSILPLQVDPNNNKSYWFSSGFGYRIHPLTERRQFHRGLDISTRRGTPVIAPADGKVIVMRQDPYLGKVIKLEHHSFQGKHITVYAHMKGFAEGLKVGDEVKRRQVIGYVGNSGRTTGPHLHYEVWTNGVVQNPRRYIILDSQRSSY